MTADSLTLTDAIDLLRGRGYLIGADPDPLLPTCSYYLQHHRGGRMLSMLTGATLRQYAAYGVPAADRSPSPVNQSPLNHD